MDQHAAVTSLSYLTPRDFGAAIDGVTDDTPAANACADYCARNGVDFKFNSGVMRVTGSIRFGLPVYTDLGWIPARTSGYQNAAALGKYIPANATSNIGTYSACNVGGESNAIVMADWLPTETQAVVEYNLNMRTSRVKVEDFTVAHPDFIYAGRVNFTGPGGVGDPTAYANNLAGLLISDSGVATVKNIRGYGLGDGVIIAHAVFWMTVESCWAQRCGDSFHFSGCNALDIKNLVAWNTRRALVIDGDRNEVNFHTQQALRSLVFLRGSQCRFYGSYCEDGALGTHDAGAGHFVYQIGVPGAGTNLVTNCTFERLATSTRRPGLQAFSIHGVTYCKFSDCRAYGGGFETSASSAVLLEHCPDWPQDQAKFPARTWGRINNGGNTMSRLSPFAVGTVISEDLIRLNSYAYGTIPANGYAVKDVTIPTRAGVAYNAATCQVTIDANTPAVATAKLINPTTLRMSFHNPSTAPLAVTTGAAVIITLWNSNNPVTVN